MKKNFVLDTNVLLHDPRSIFGFGDNDVIIPIYVIEEIDNFKRDLSTLGRNARQVSRYLDEFRVQGKLRDGVPIGEGKGHIRVLVAERKLPPTVAVDGHSVDDKILAVALELLDRENAECRPSSSRRTRTSASARTRSGCTPRTTTSRGSRSTSSGAASPSWRSRPRR